MDSYENFSEITAALRRHKPRNTVSNVIGVISDMSEKLTATCKVYSKDVPEILGKDKPRLIEVLSDIQEFLNELKSEE